MKFFLKPANTTQFIDTALLILRVGFSLLMMRYGYAKLDKFIGGDYAFADPIGMGEQLSLLLTIGAEFFCSILLILGLFSRIALMPLIFTMLVALFIVHRADDFDMKEHPIIFLIPYITLFLTGPGTYSLDYYFRKRE